MIEGLFGKLRSVKQKLIIFLESLDTYHIGTSKILNTYWTIKLFK